MELGGIPTRFEGWRRGPALAVVAVLLLALIAACWTPAGSSTPAPKLRATESQPGDLNLYREIIKGVHDGGNYYEVAAAAQRKNSFPLKPFTTFRLPTHATIYAFFGEQVMIAVLWLLTALTLFLWWSKVRALAPPVTSAAAVILMGGGVGALLQAQTGIFHESWTAILLALMLVFYRPGKAWPAMIAGGSALMIRELALPMIMLMMGWAMLGRRWKEAAGWAAIIAVFAVYLALHAQWVGAVVLPSDNPSPGWLGFNGFQFALKSIAMVTMGIAMPSFLARGLLLLSLFGWMSVRKGWAFLVSCELLGYGTMLALFARTDTFYWALIPAPFAFVGLAFLPGAFADLAKALRRVPMQSA